MNTTQRLTEFIDTEKQRFEIHHHNMFLLSFREVLTYYQFLNIIQGRYETIEQEYYRNIKAVQEIHQGSGPGTHVANEELLKLYEAVDQLFLAYRLEAESFYIFAKITLDKIVHAIGFYFGEGRGISLVSHDKLKKNINKYASLKGLVLPDGFVALVEKLKADISDFRDKQIEHEKDPRTVRPVMFNSEGKVKIIVKKIYPKGDGVEQIVGSHIYELKREIEDYIENTIRLIEENRDKTALTLEEING